MVKLPAAVFLGRCKFEHKQPAIAPVAIARSRSWVARLIYDRTSFLTDRARDCNQGLRSAHIPYHYPPAYGDLYPPLESFAVATHPTLDASQPLLGWYDQAVSPLIGLCWLLNLVLALN